MKRPASQAIRPPRPRWYGAVAVAFVLLNCAPEIELPPTAVVSCGGMLWEGRDLGDLVAPSSGDVKATSAFGASGPGGSCTVQAEGQRVFAVSIHATGDLEWLTVAGPPGAEEPDRVDLDDVEGLIIPSADDRWAVAYGRAWAESPQSGRQQMYMAEVRLLIQGRPYADVLDDLEELLLDAIDYIESYYERRDEQRIRYG